MPRVLQISPEAKEVADANHVTIFQADIIYHLFDRCMEHFERVSAVSTLRYGAVARCQRI